MNKINDFKLHKEGDIITIQIIDKCYDFNEQDFTILKTFMFDFLSEVIKLHSVKGFLHTNDIDKILKLYDEY